MTRWLAWEPRVILRKRVLFEDPAIDLVILSLQLAIDKYCKKMDTNKYIKVQRKTMTSSVERLSRITQTPGQCGGKPCIRGMRIRVSDILEMMAENVSFEEILLDFPDLEADDIQACLLFAAKRTEFPRLTA